MRKNRKNDSILETIRKNITNEEKSRFENLKDFLRDKANQVNRYFQY
jgi:hypothetical protein